MPPGKRAAPVAYRSFQDAPILSEGKTTKRDPFPLIPLVKVALASLTTFRSAAQYHLPTFRADGHAVIINFAWVSPLENIQQIYFS